MTLDEAQVWTAIGILGGTLVGTTTALITLTMTTINAKFDAFGTRLDHLDRDVNALMKHSFGVDRGRGEE